MDNNFKILINKFKLINKQGYIKGVNNILYNSAGLTFEALLSKKADTLCQPDYNGIEIKTTQRYSGYPITLFSCKFDGPKENEANELLEKYGYESKNKNITKELILSLKLNQKKHINNQIFFELKIDYIEQIIYINIYKNEELLEKRAIISFKNIKIKFETKLQKLALIFASKKVFNNQLYFRYYKINCYIAKDFNHFIKLISDNTLKLTLMLKESKTQNNKNKNIVFSIYKDKIAYLFEEIYSYEN